MGALLKKPPPRRPPWLQVLPGGLSSPLPEKDRFIARAGRSGLIALELDEFNDQPVLSVAIGFQSRFLIFEPGQMRDLLEALRKLVRIEKPL